MLPDEEVRWLWSLVADAACCLPGQTWPHTASSRKRSPTSLSTGDRLAITVTNNGSGPPPTATSAAGSGYGLIGMRERAMSVGGRLRAGPAGQAASRSSPNCRRTPAAAWTEGDRSYGPDLAGACASSEGGTTAPERMRSGTSKLVGRLTQRDGCCLAHQETIHVWYVW